MNIYPAWWDTTITIYNRYEDKQTQLVKWFSFVIPGCFWKANNNRVTVNDTVLDGSNILCRIPKHPNFLERYDWEQLPNDMMGDYFTLGRQDIIVKGATDFEIDEYIKGHRSTDLLAKYNNMFGCMQIEQFSINTGAGRNDEHYLVTGI